MTANGLRGGHYSRLEIGCKTMNSLTRVAKDTLIIEVYELDSIRPSADKDKDTASADNRWSDGGKRHNLNGIQEPTPCDRYL